MGRGEILIEPDCLAALGNGIVHQALLPQRITEASVGQGVILLEPDGHAVLGDGVV